MAVDRLAVMERLRLEGRWEQAQQFKFAKIKEYRSQGMKRSEAGERAWADTEAEFPPLPPADEQEDFWDIDEDEDWLDEMWDEDLPD